MTERPTTRWAQEGYGWWRWYRGVMLRIIDVTETAEVDGRYLSSEAPVMSCVGHDDPRDWCERWAEVLVEELDR